MASIWSTSLLLLTAMPVCAATALRARHSALRVEELPAAKPTSGVLWSRFAANSSGSGHVDAHGHGASASSSDELLCMLKHIAVKGEVRSEPQVKGKLSKRWKDCAVVSNSGTLSGKFNGDYVNTAELVFRFNSAPTIGHELFVGSKEDVRIVNNKYLPRVHGKATTGGQTGTYLVKSNVAYVVVGPEDKYHEVFAEEFPLAELYRLDPAVSDSFSEVVQNLYNSSVLDPEHAHGRSYSPTSGGLGMMLALTVCDEVYAFGMASTPNAEISSYHYYDKHIGKRADQNQWHKTFSAEKDLWRRLATNSQEQIDQTEVAYIPGFSQAKCPGVSDGTTSVSWQHM